MKFSLQIESLDDARRAQVLLGAYILSFGCDVAPNDTQSDSVTSATTARRGRKPAAVSTDPVAAYNTLAAAQGVATVPTEEPAAAAPVEADPVEIEQPAPVVTTEPATVEQPAGMSREQIIPEIKRLAVPLGAKWVKANVIDAHGKSTLSELTDEQLAAVLKQAQADTVAA